MSEAIFREILKLKKLKLETLEMLHKKLFDAEYTINSEYLHYTMASRLYGFKFRGDHWGSLRDIMKEIVAGKLDEKKFFRLRE